MANTATIPKQTSEDVIPFIGNNKVWCLDMTRIRPSDTFNEIMRNGTVILTKITSESLTFTNPSNMDDIYIKTFPTLFKEKQQTSEVTNLLTPDVTREIYIKIGEIIQNVYTMNNLIDQAFSDTNFDSTTVNNLTESIKNTYKKYFSKDEVVNIFELETPSSLTKPIAKISPTSATSYYVDNGLSDKRVLFSSIGINTTISGNNNINGETLNVLSDSPKSVSHNLGGSVISKQVYEYARNFGLEIAVHSKMLSAVDSFSRRTSTNVSSGFMITRDKTNDITGLIFYYTLIIPRPYLKNELTKLVGISNATTSSTLSADTKIDSYNKYIADRSVYDSNGSNPNNRESYIAISSSFNFFDLVKYIPIRKSIVSSNLISVLGLTFDTLNGVNGQQFNSNNDPEWEFGYPSEYENLKCILSPRYTEWAGKKISDCVIPYSTIDYPRHIFNLISNINRQIDRSSIINNHKFVICDEVGDDKLIFIVNMRVGVNGKMSFQTKEIQYNLLFPAKIINADTEVSGEFTVKKTIGTELMKVDPITNITTFFTKVGINQPSHEIEGLFNIDNLTYSLVKTFINDFKTAILSSNNISNAVINSGVTNDIKNNIQSTTTTNTMFNIPLKQYMSLTTVYPQISRIERMNLLTAKVEAQFLALAIQRVQAKIAENEFRIQYQNTVLDELYAEKRKQEEIELWISIGLIVADVLASTLALFIGNLGKKISILTELIIEALVATANAVIQDTDWTSVAIKDSDVISNAAANIPEDIDTGSAVCQYLIDSVYIFIGQLRVERQELEDELDELQTRLETYTKLNATSKNKIKTNTINSTTLKQEISALRQEIDFLNKIVANKQIVNKQIRDASNNLIGYKKEERDNIVLGRKDPFVDSSTYVNSNKLTNSTTISDFEHNYHFGTSLPQFLTPYIISGGSLSFTNSVYKNVYNVVTDKVTDPSSVEVIITVTNNTINKIEVTRCNQMFYKGDQIQFNFNNKTITVTVPSNSEDLFIQNIFTDASKNNVNINSTSVLNYINNVYLPKKAKTLLTKIDESNSLNNKSLQNAVIQVDLSGALASSQELSVSENSLKDLQESLNYYNDLITTIDSMIDTQKIGSHTVYRLFKDEWQRAATDTLKSTGKFYNRARQELFVNDHINNTAIGTSGDKTYGTNMVGNSIPSIPNVKLTLKDTTTGKLRFYNNINALNKQISAKIDEIEALKLKQTSTNKDELQQITELYLLTNESHNKLRNIINNIWQLYADASYNKLAAIENYTIYTNLVDNEKSNTYAFNINILNRDTTLTPYVIITSSTIDTTKYTVDLSYRDKFESIMTEVGGACELINYVTIIFKSNPYVTINKEKTIEEQIYNDNLFVSRFDCNSFITIDNLTDNIIVADELNPQWIGQSFDNIIMTNTETTLSSIYDIIYESFIKDYAKIEYNRNYLVEYTVNGVSNLCVLRYIQLITLNKTTNKSELKDYRIYCKVALDSLVDKAMNISGDSTLYGDFNVKPNLTDDSMFQIDTFNKNIINMSKVGIGTFNPDAMLDITDTTMTDVIHMDSVIEQQLYTMKKMINDISSKTYSELVDFIITEASGYTLSDDYFYCYKLPDLSGGKMYAENITVLYHGAYMSWNSLTYAEIIKQLPGFADQIINNILPENQHNLDNNFLYEGSMYTTTHAFNNGTKRSYHLVFRWRGKLCVLGTGSMIETYNIDKNMNNKKTDDMLEYTDKQLKFMNYVKSKNNRRNRLVDLSGTEVDIHNKDKASAELESSMNTYPALSNDIDIYYAESSNTSILDVYVDDISSAQTYIANERNVIYDKYTMLGDVDNIYIRNKVSDMPITSGKEKHVAFLNTLKSKNDNDLNNLKHNQAGFVVYNDQYNYYRSIYYINKKLTSDTTYQMHIYSFHMKYNDYIGNTLNIHGDVLMEGGLSLVNTYNNKPHVTINPFNKYVGVNTSERFINYADMYTTTASIYNTPHNLIVSNDKYPNAVFDRIQESQQKVSVGDYTYFGSYSGATIRRTSNLFLYDASFMKFVGLNNRITANSNEPRTMIFDNWATYKHYGPDVSFEVKDCSGITTELGQLKMVIDKIDTNGNIQAGFGVQVVDATMGGNSIDKNMKNLMYVNNDKRLFINDIVLGNKVLTVDANYNLNWNNKTILVEDSAIVNDLTTVVSRLDTSMNDIKANKANLSGANFTGDVSIAGNFTVTGTTTTLSTTNLDISDSIIGLSRGAPTGFTHDAGFIFNRGTDASNQAFGFISQNKKFTLGSTDTLGGSTTLNITPGTLIANLEGNVYGTLTGPTINRLDTSMNDITLVVSTLDTSMNDLTLVVSTLDTSMNDLTLVVSTLDTSVNALETMLSRKLDIFTNISATRSLTQVGSYIIDASDIILTLPTPDTPGQLITLYSGLTGANTYILNNGNDKTSTISSGTVTLCISTGTSTGNWVVYSAGLLKTFI
jgi:hypothetical protein